MWVTKRHCLEYVIEHGLAFIHEQNFDAASQLLQPFPQLQALVLLLSVDHPSVSSIEAKQKLIDALWSNRTLETRQEAKLDELKVDLGDANVTMINCSEPKVELWCDQLSFMVQLAWWYTDQYNSILPEDRVPENKSGVWRASAGTTNASNIDERNSPVKYATRQIANSVLQALETNSVVRVIRECLPSIPAYAKSATGAVDKSELAEETVGLLDFLSKRPRGTKEIENEHQQDMMLLRSYYAMKMVFQWFYNAVAMDQTKAKARPVKRKKNSGSVRRTKLEALADVDKNYRIELQRDSQNIVRLLSGITSLPIRLTALENVFSLLFLSKDHMIGGLKNAELKRSTAANLAAQIVEESTKLTDPNTLDSAKGISKSASSTGLSNLPFSQKSQSARNNPSQKMHREQGSYIANSNLLKVVLHALKQCLETAKEEWKNTAPPEDMGRHKEYERTGDRIRTLLQYVEEGMERVKVLELSKKHFKRSSSEFMKRMFASPQSLLNMCLKRSDYKSAKRVIKFFQIPNVRSNEVILAETLDDIAKDLKTGDSEIDQMNFSLLNRLVDIQKDHYEHEDAETMASLDYKLHGFYMTVDLAISAAPTIQQSSLLLK